MDVSFTVRRNHVDWLASCFEVFISLSPRGIKKWLKT